jgi:N-acetylmuramoyl-L-alanine amidase
MNRRFYALLVLIVVVLSSLALAGVFNRRAPAAQPAPAPPPATVIALDPGHGGRDPGGVTGDTLEKDVNLAIAKRLADLLAAQPGLMAVLTRSSDMTLDKLERVRIAEESGAVLILSIHVNAFSDAGVHGAQTMVDASRSSDDPSWLLADSVQAALIDATGARDRGVLAQDLYLQHTTLPAAWVEAGFLTSSTEGPKLSDPAYQSKIAHGLLNGILAYLAAIAPPEAPAA